MFLNLFVMKIEDALLLLAASACRTMSVREAVEIIELVTRNPAAIKEILKTAEEQGIIERDDKTITISEGAAAFPKPKITRADCDSSCRRCGVRIKNCHYIEFDDHRLGPYGSECVNKIL
jgi:predicted methyltransferase